MEDCVNCTVHCPIDWDAPGLNWDVICCNIPFYCLFTILVSCHSSLAAVQTLEVKQQDEAAQAMALQQQQQQGGPPTRWLLHFVCVIFPSLCLVSLCMYAWRQTFSWCCAFYSSSSLSYYCPIYVYYYTAPTDSPSLGAVKYNQTFLLQNCLRWFGIHSLIRAAILRPEMFISVCKNGWY